MGSNSKLSVFFALIFFVLIFASVGFAVEIIDLSGYRDGNAVYLTAKCTSAVSANVGIFAIDGTTSLTVTPESIDCNSLSPTTRIVLSILPANKDIFMARASISSPLSACTSCVREVFLRNKQVVEEVNVPDASPFTLILVVFVALALLTIKKKT